ncbi:hypothetical protein HPB50_005117 [Hyalomma asiaticum]|uniref:Uncharacterized protein n=1 Tax=Hyalomma asiaticum TaxID=266040 RepID=A0ACB7TF47_HYAAI|nr:hypothetical protein HPB50_005117 [Hyalomma asiaticum]
MRAHAFTAGRAWLAVRRPSDGRKMDGARERKRGVTGGGGLQRLPMLWLAGTVVAVRRTSPGLDHPTRRRMTAPHCHPGLRVGSRAFTIVTSWLAVRGACTDGVDTKKALAPRNDDDNGGCDDFADGADLSVPARIDLDDVSVDDHDDLHRRRRDDVVREAYHRLRLPVLLLRIAGLLLLFQLHGTRTDAANRYDVHFTNPSLRFPCDAEAAPRRKLRLRLRHYRSVRSIRPVESVDSMSPGSVTSTRRLPISV